MDKISPRNDDKLGFNALYRFIVQTRFHLRLMNREDEDHITESPTLTKWRDIVACLTTIGELSDGHLQKLYHSLSDMVSGTDPNTFINLMEEYERTYIWLKLKS